MRVLRSICIGRQCRSVSKRAPAKLQRASLSSTGKEERTDRAAGGERDGQDSSHFQTGRNASGGEGRTTHILREVHVALDPGVTVYGRQKHLDKDPMDQEMDKDTRAMQHSRRNNACRQPRGWSDNSEQGGKGSTSRS